MKYKEIKSVSPLKSKTLKDIYIQIPLKKIIAHPIIQDALIPKQIIYFEPIIDKIDQMPIKKIEITSRNNRQGKVFNKINQFYSFLNSRKHITKINENNITKTKELYEEKPILKRETCNDDRVNYSVNSIFQDKEKDPDDLINFLIKQYKQRNIRLPHINSRDKHNLFKQNPLLQSKKTLDKYYLLHRDKSVVDNTNQYLDNIQNTINKKLHPKQINFIKRMSMMNQSSMKESSLFRKKFEEKSKEFRKSIYQNKREIKTLSKTIEDLDLIDEFYSTTNLVKDFREHKRKDQANLQSYKTFLINYKNKGKDNEKKTDINRLRDTTKYIFKNTDIIKKAQTSKYNDLKTKMKKIIFKINNNSNNTSRSSVQNNQKKSLLEQLYFDCSNESKDTSAMNITLINDYMKNNKDNLFNDTSSQGLVCQINNVQRTASLRNYVKETYDIQGLNGLKIDLLPNQKELVERSQSLDQSIRKSQSHLLKVLLNGMICN